MSTIREQNELSGRPNAVRAAAFQERADSGSVICRLCPHQCHLRPHETGRCHVRQNRNGVLRALTYGTILAAAIDPVEKKPLRRFIPGTETYSVGYAGCNLRCLFCQNTDLSFADLQEGDPETTRRIRAARRISPEEVVERALQAGTPSISYTYNEPLVAYESVLETARLAHDAGMKNILVTNGFICPKPLQALLPHIDAMNIDLKAMKDEQYQHWCNGRLQPVLDTIRTSTSACHVEVTTLVVTGMNDSEEALRPAFAWLGGLGRNIPLHITRYFPANRWTAPPPPVSLLLHLQEVAQEYLEDVYVGNI